MVNRPCLDDDNGDYSETRQKRENPEKYTRRRKLLHELEVILSEEAERDVRLNAVETNRSRVTNLDLETLLQAVRDIFGRKPWLVAVNQEQREYLVKKELDKMEESMQCQG